MKLIGLLIVTVLLVILYVLYIRPLFERLGWVHALPPAYLSYRDRLAAWARNSATMAIAKMMTWCGAMLQAAASLDVAEIKAQLADLGLGPKFGIALAVLGIIVMLARLRNLPSRDA